ncbi:carbohydrate kinase family protein [Streptomyces sp. AcH 505]|uniref:PfkB family carbohydrate kinase n=1 Tax=Streptomyces sp. AcH 505 TaxID=352211 RepID=UPI0005AA0E03
MAHPTSRTTRGHRVLVTGSIATDHLMTYPGRFAEQLLTGQLESVSLSFLADTLEIRRGGVGANIALGLARLGLAPVLAGSAGADFADYGAWLAGQGVDVTPVRVSDTLHTARFVCTTDADHNQIATFYAGAMAEARHISLTRTVAGTGRPELVLIAPDDPEAMLRHTTEARAAGLPFAADPSQQLARLDRGATRRLVDGARHLFTNAYEAGLLRERTGWTDEQVLAHVDTWVVTRGADGVDLLRAGEAPLRVPAVPTDVPAEPTGVGDAFRAGFLAGLSWSLPAAAAARLGCAVATVVLETVGTQDYQLNADELLLRVKRAHGEPAAAELAGPLGAGIERATTGGAG